MSKGSLAEEFTNFILKCYDQYLLHYHHTQATIVGYLFEIRQCQLYSNQIWGEPNDESPSKPDWKINGISRQIRKENDI